MATFSQRKGLKPMQKVIQTGELDRELRNQLWSVFTLSIFEQWRPKNMYGERSNAKASERVELLYRRIWFSHFKLPIDSVPEPDPTSSSGAYAVLRRKVLEGPWNEVLDIVEFVIQNIPKDWQEPTANFCNKVLEAENAAYRLVDNQIVEITDEIEISSISKALINPKDAIRTHLQESLTCLSDRKSPNYRNAIKESISAVEAACQVLTNSPGATLPDCLRIIKAQHLIPTTLDQALTKLYAYTSGAGGIRHALTEESVQPTFADAKFMLVSCTAFINYLWTIAAETGMKINDQEK